LRVGHISIARRYIYEGDDATVRIGAGDNGEDGEQQPHAATGRACLVPGADRERLPAGSTAARMRSRQPPNRLPLDESDIFWFGNPFSFQQVHIDPQVLHPGLTPSLARALNSPGRRSGVFRQNVIGDPPICLKLSKHTPGLIDGESDLRGFTRVIQFFYHTFEIEDRIHRQDAYVDVSVSYHI